MRSSGWDLTLNGEGYTLYTAPNKPAKLAAGFVSAQPNGPLPGAEAVRLFEDFSGGMGFSRRLIKNGYERAQNADTRWPNVVFAGPEVVDVPLPSLGHAINGSFELNWRSGYTDVFFLSGQYGLMSSNGHDAPAGAVNFGTGFVAMSATQHAGGPVFVSGSGGYIWRLDTSGWTQSSDTTRRHLAQVYWTIGGGIAGSSGQGGVGDYRMLGTDSTLAGFYWLTATHLGPNPLLSASWTPSTPVIVGNGAYQIQRIVTTNRTAYFVKTNGVHSVDGAGYSPNLTPYWETHLDLSWNGSAAVVFHGKIRAAHANYLDAVSLDGTVNQGPQPCGPGEGLHPNESTIWGHYSALAVIGNELWAAKYNPNANTSYLCVGRPRVDGEDGYSDLVWHGALCEFTGQVTHIAAYVDHADTYGRGYVWIAIDNSGTYSLKRIMLPRGGNPLQDPLYRFARTWSLWTGLDDGGEQNSWTKKITRRCDVYADNVTSSGGTIQVALSADGAAYADQGLLGGQARTSFLTDQIEGTMIGMRIDGTGSETDTPRLRSTALHEIMLPEQVKRRTFQILVGTDDDRRSPQQVVTQLEALQNTGDVTMEWNDSTYTVKILPGITEDNPIDVDGVTLLHVINVTVDIIRRHWEYDDGTHYDSGEYWG